MDRFLVPKSKYRLTPTYNVFSISHNLKHGPRKQTFQSKVQYKYKARIDLLKKNTDPTRFRDGYPKDKAGAIDLIRRVHGTDSITVGPPDTFDGTHKKTGSDRVRCNICVDYPQPMLRATHKKEAEGIFSAAGRPWKLQKVVSHFVGKPHYEALSASRAHDLKLHLALHPEENVNNYTQNVLERACAERKQTIYETRIKHVGMVYTDMKCLTLSSNSFPARDLVDSYCDHLLELKDDDFKPFIPTPDDCRYNNPTAHKRYRTMLSDDITEHFVKPLFANVLAASVAYDGWRAFHELYIHGSRLVFKDGTIKHVFIALVDPTGGGAAGCVESFNLAYKRVFDDETTFNDFMECVVCQTSDGAAVNTGAEAGANVTIRTDIIKNPNLPELICDTHCGHNAWKDWLKAFDVIYRVITQHNAFVSFTHRGDIMKDLLTQLVEEQGETARSIFHLRLINKAWNEAMKTQRLRREYMSIACYFNVSKDDAEEYVCCFSDKEEELYHRVIGQTICDRSWMLLSVNDMLLFCKSMFQERMSKNDIRQKMMDYYHVTYNTVKNDYRCRLALKIFKSRIESDDYY
eukprot:1041610_1